MGSPALSVSGRGSLLARESPCRALGPPEVFGKPLQSAGPIRSLRKCSCSVQGQSEAFGMPLQRARPIRSLRKCSCRAQGHSEAFGKLLQRARPIRSLRKCSCRAQGPSEAFGETALQRAGRNFPREGRPCSVQGLSYDKGGVHRGALRLRRVCYNRQPIPAAVARPRPGGSSARHRPWAHTCWSGTSPRSA